MDDFWKDIDTLAASPARGALQVGQVLDLYLDLVSTRLSELTDAECNSCAERLLDSKPFHSDTVYARKRLAGLLDLKGHEERDYIVFLGVVLIADSRHGTAPLENIVESDLIRCLIHIIWLYRHTEPNVLNVYLELLYRVGTVQAWPRPQLDHVSAEFVSHLFIMIRDHQIGGRLALRALLALNDQFLLASPDGPSATSLVFDVLRSRLAEFREVGSYLVWEFNRSSSQVQRVLTAKLCYLLLSCDKTSDFFYLNDLKVLLDVLVRELDDLSSDQVELRVMYLRLLPLLVEGTGLKDESYRRGDIKFVLESTLESSQSQPVVISLVKTCLTDAWFQDQQDYNTGLTTNPSPEPLEHKDTVPGLLRVPATSVVPPELETEVSPFSPPLFPSSPGDQEASPSPFSSPHFSGSSGDEVPSLSIEEKLESPFLSPERVSGFKRSPNPPVRRPCPPTPRRLQNPSAPQIVHLRPPPPPPRRPSSR